MATCKCGDPVNYKMTFSGWQGDKSALVVLSRLPKDSLKTFAVDVQNGDVEVKWPDLENGSDYFGGAKAYLDDLPGTWVSKWNTQDYDFEVIVESTRQLSGPMTIEREPDKGVTTVSPIIPIVLYNRNLGGLLVLGGKVSKAIMPKPKKFPCDMGRFDLEFKDGEVVMTVAIELISKGPGVPADIFQQFKDNVEGFWNGPNGFRRAALHRKACVRKDVCDCLIAYDSSGTGLSAGGCCKYPVRLVVEQGYRHSQGFTVTAEGFFKRMFGDPAYAMGPGKGFGRITYPDVSNTWAHEVGHCIGQPDQYMGGHLWDHPGGKFPVKLSSIMGIRQNKADKDHLVHAEDFMGADFYSMDYP